MEGCEDESGVAREGRGRGDGIGGGRGVEDVVGEGLYI